MRVDSDRVKEQADIVRVIGQFVELKKQGAEFVALCPFHQERSPSFTVQPSEQFFKCFGCGEGGDVFAFVQKIEGLQFPDAVRRVGELTGVPVTETPPKNGTAPQPSERGKITAVYRYTDEAGEALYEICRIEPGKGGRKKDFLQRYRDENGAAVWKKHPRQVLYNLPLILAAETVHICEGEKDADSLTTLGWVGTTNAGGSNAKWLPEYTESLRGKRAVIWPDQDAPGITRGAAIAKAVPGSITVNVPGVKDVTDYLEAGHAFSDLEQLVADAEDEARRELLENKGLLTPAEIIDADGGYSVFCNPASRKRGVETGFRVLDSMTLGMHPGQMIVLAARPAMGKTALALNIASNAIDKGVPVAVFSLEMSRGELLTRLVCSRARVDLMKHRGGFLSPGERHSFSVAMGEVVDLPMMIDDRSSIDAKTIDAQLEPLRGRVGLVVVDYMQLMSSRGRENRTQEVGAISRGMKLLAKKYRIPFLVLSQLNRSVETRPGDNVPKLSDLRESGSIEQDADMVWFIHRPEYYKPDREDLRGLAEIHIAKQRNGPVGKVNLVFLREITRFENRAAEF